MNCIIFVAAHPTLPVPCSRARLKQAWLRYSADISHSSYIGKRLLLRRGAPLRVWTAKLGLAGMGEVMVCLSVLQECYSTAANGALPTTCSESRCQFGSALLTLSRSEPSDVWMVHSRLPRRYAYGLQCICLGSLETDVTAPFSNPRGVFELLYIWIGCVFEILGIVCFPNEYKKIVTI